MYNIVIYLYLTGVAIASLFSEKVKKMWRGERQTIKLLREKVDPDAKYVWFHAASLGEFEQGRPLMERLRQTHPEYKILLTFFSPSGYEVRKDYKGTITSTSFSIVACPSTACRAYSERTRCSSVGTASSTARC